MPRRRTYTFLSACAFAAVAMILPFSGCPQVVPAIYEVEVLKDVVYAVGNVSDGTQPPEWQIRELLLDVYSPVDADGLLPAVILVHGGSFSEGSKEKLQIVEYARFFAGQGFVAFAINYRLSGDHPPAPEAWQSFNLVAAAHAAMVDVKAAIRFVRAEAAAYQVDPQRIALLGESAGAIAGVTAAVTDSELFQTDGPGFPLPETNYPGVSSRIQAYVHLWGSADHVLLYIDAADPPTMIVHGTEDDEFFASFEASERFAAVLEFRGVPYIFYEAEGFDHGAWNFAFRRQRIPHLALAFFEEHLAQ